MFAHNPNPRIDRLEIARDILHVAENLLESYGVTDSEDPTILLLADDHRGIGLSKDLNTGTILFVPGSPEYLATIKMPDLQSVDAEGGLLLREIAEDSSTRAHYSSHYLACIQKGLRDLEEHLTTSG